MDYLNEFKWNCKSTIDQNKVIISNAPTIPQRTTEFERNLTEVLDKIDKLFKEHLEGILKLALKNGYKDIIELEKSMKFLITDYKRDFMNNQKEKSGLYK